MMKSKKIMKRLFGILMSIVMMIGMMATTAFAADGSATITITKPEEITTNWSGMTVKAYMVLDQKNPEVTDESLKQYEVTDSFRDFFDISNVKNAFGKEGNVYLTYDTTNNRLEASNTESKGAIIITNHQALDLTYPEADLVGRMQTQGAEISTFYTWIEKYIENKPVTETTSVIATAADQVGFSNLLEGYYALTFSEVPDGISVKQGILVATSGSIDLKAETLPLTKQVKPVDNKTAYAESATAELGEALSYEITSKVPTLTDYGNLTQFVFTDTMVRQSTDSSTFNLEIEGETVIKDGNQFKIGENVVANLDLGQYTTVQDPTDPSKTVPGQSFTLTFVTDVLKNYQGRSITLTYQAALTGDAININPNIITLTYTNGPDTSELTSSTQVYTYGIEVQKNFSSAAKPYEGVTFTLCADNNGSKGATINLVGNNGVYNVPGVDEKTDSTQKTEILKLDATGKLTITGLDEGSYWLEEVSAPTGYTKAQDIKITLVKDSENPGNLDKDDSTALYGGSGTDDLLKTVTNQDTTNISLGQFTVLNQKGFSLPQTGGAGTWMLTIGGIILIAAAAGLFVASRRKSFSK